MTYYALVALAATANEIVTPEEMDQFGLGEAYKKAEAAAKAEAEKDAVEAIKTLIQKDNHDRLSRRTAIRNLKNRIEVVKGELEAQDRARAYAAATNNFIPWAALLGLGANDMNLTAVEYARLSVIPSGWTPPAKSTAT